MNEARSRPAVLDRECDWVIKHRLVEAYRERHQLPPSHPKMALLDLQYHDVTVLYEDSFKSRDERVEKLIASL